MKITLNGESHSISQTDISSMLDENGYQGMLVAVAVNGTFVPRSEHATTKLNEGDEIDIVAPMQGG